jgi:hypothetical protein
MSADFEDRMSSDGLTDDELQRLVREELETQASVDADNILVRVSDGVVHLAGRVGTDAERRVAEHVVTDILGASTVQNAIVVDPIRRDEEPEAIDDHLANQMEQDGASGSRSVDQHSDSAEHLEENLDAQLYGTHDVQQAIERGTAWEPPDSPTPEGIAGQEPDIRQYGEDH